MMEVADMDEILIKKPIPKNPYQSPLKPNDDFRGFTERRERRAGELGISLYVLGNDEDQTDEFQQLEDYIIENFIDFDLDVPESIKQKYLQLKKAREASGSRHTAAPAS